MTDQIIRMGISTCPNDTFAFHALLTGAIPTGSLRFEFELLDVQELNDRLGTGDFNVTKASYHAALKLAEQVVVFPSGSALGYGVGPLLLAHEDYCPKTSPSPRVLSPGRLTTAALLYNLFYSTGELKHVVFSQIIPGLIHKQADLGLCIHEGRFTYSQHPLKKLADLGELWEQRTRCALPLGGIFGQKSLPATLLWKIQEAIAQSIKYGHEHPQQALISMRKYAQELADEVLWSHVKLYVNNWTSELGAEGRQSIAMLCTLAKEGGLIRSNTELEVLRKP